VSSSEKAWLVVALCAVTTFAIRAFGPATVGAHTLGPRTLRILALLPAALLAALVVTETFVDDGALVVDAKAGGLAAAGFALWRGASVIWVVIGAAAVTALLRLIF
jgi:branched-subunit amino acid transport protein